MSGGHYDYAYGVVQSFAENMLTTSTYDEDLKDYVEIAQPNVGIRLKIHNHLLKVSNLMRSIEWCDSGDTGEEDCLKDMLDFLKEIE